VQHHRIRPSAIRARLRPSYTPQWINPFDIYAKRYVDKHFWRVKHAYITKEDALQECAMVFARCARTYAGRIDNPAWFMGIYKIALVNEFNSAALRDTKNRFLVMPGKIPDDVFDGHASDSVGELMVEFAQCKTELEHMVQTFQGMSDEVFAYLTQGSPDRMRRIKRMMGPLQELSARITDGYVDQRASSRSDARDILSMLKELLS
jgi:hypothetical protein